MNLTLDTIGDIKLYQNKRGYRFSVDALLLYSFVNLHRAYRIADLGAGSGIIGILLAKRYPKAEITLIELQKSLAELAKRNIVLNNLQDRVTVIKNDIRDIDTIHLFTNSPLHRFDLVVSNPPFRRQRTGLISPSDEKRLQGMR